MKLPSLIKVFLNQIEVQLKMGNPYIYIYIYIYINICDVGISDENVVVCGNNLGDLKLNDNQGTNAIPQ